MRCECNMRVRMAKEALIRCVLLKLLRHFFPSTKEKEEDLNWCVICDSAGTLRFLSGGGGAEMWACRKCGAVYNLNPFGIELRYKNWLDYPCHQMFKLPDNLIDKI